jgi:hypothetical protein
MSQAPPGRDVAANFDMSEWKPHIFRITSGPPFEPTFVVRDCVGLNLRGSVERALVLGIRIRQCCLAPSSGQRQCCLGQSSLGALV